MAQVLGILGGAATLLGVAAYLWRVVHLRQTVRDRLGSTLVREETHTPRVAVNRRSALRRWRWIPCLVGVAVGLAIALLTPLPWLFGITFGFIVAMLGLELEGFLAARRSTKIETQLADAIDLMVGALGAGAGIMSALENAARESARPLRPLLEDALGRIRYGDAPATVFSALADRVPLETFLLFGSTLTAQWEVGGSLAPTLSMVGRTIRDRIEIARRIRANIAQSQFSTVFVLLISYFVAIVVWRTNPGQMAEFLETTIGQVAVAGSMILQAVGIAWMSLISRMKY